MQLTYLNYQGYTRSQITKGTLLKIYLFKCVMIKFVKEDGHASFEILPWWYTTQCPEWHCAIQSQLRKRSETEDQIGRKQKNVNTDPTRWKSSWPLESRWPVISQHSWWWLVQRPQTFCKSIATLSRTTWRGPQNGDKTTLFVFPKIPLQTIILLYHFIQSPIVRNQYTCTEGGQNPNWTEVANMSKMIR